MNKGGVATLAAVVLLCGCVDSPETKALPDGTVQERIQALSSHVVEVSEPVKNEVLMVTHFQKSAWSGRYWIWTFLDDAKLIMSRLDEATRGVPYKRVAFMVHLPTRDNLGREGQQLGMKVIYDREKIAGAKWGDMTPFDMSEIPDEVSFRPLGRELAIEYCKDGDNAKFSRRFCAQALR